MKNAFKIAALCLFVLVAYISYIYYLDWHDRQTYRRVVHKNQCRLNLLLIWDAANGYVAKNDDLPRDRDGNFSLQVLKEQFRPDLELNCPARREFNSIDYEFAKDISVNDFKISKLPIRVIGCEKSINHFGDRRILLLSNRTVYEAPVRDGEKTSSNFPWDFTIPEDD
jgi:hypothetical protein